MKTVYFTFLHHSEPKYNKLWHIQIRDHSSKQRKEKFAKSYFISLLFLTRSLNSDLLWDWSWELVYYYTDTGPVQWYSSKILRLSCNLHKT